VKLKPKAIIRMRQPAEPPLIGDFLAEQAARRRSALAQGRPQLNVAAATFNSPGRRKLMGTRLPV
jgi:hypothetical protein